MASAFFDFREEPEADGNLRAVEELAEEGDHDVFRCAQDLRSGFALRKCAIAQGSVHEVSLDEGAADVALPRQAMRFGLQRFNCAPRRVVAGLVRVSRDCGAVGEKDAKHAPVRNGGGKILESGFTFGGHMKRGGKRSMNQEIKQSTVHISI